MNRINRKFKELKAVKKAAFIAYITAGFPNLGATEKLVPALEKAGADIIEMGIPFSDPVADGRTIQEASQAALAAGVTVKKILASVKNIRKTSAVPVALMTYYNPVFHYGVAGFMRDAAAAGVDGIIVPDLPPEEGQEFRLAARRNGIATVFFLAPTTQKARIPIVAQATTGFIYYVSTTGVTGARQDLPKELLANIKKAKAMTAKPVCVGFGISTPAQVKAVGRVADGVIVGSAIVKKINEYQSSPDAADKVARFVRQLAAALR